MKIKDIKNWFEIAIPEPTIEQACIQIGCHYEEVSEMMWATSDHYMSRDVSSEADHYKESRHENVVTVRVLDNKKRLELLDSLCDQIVTAIGVAHMLGMDIEGALAEVNASNHSKFENGKAVFDRNGKIAKGKDYFKPELLKHIGS